jgi:hypothetical protein
MIGESHGAKHLWHSIAIQEIINTASLGEKFEMHLYDVIHFYLSLY